MNRTITFCILIVALCVCFPPLFGFVFGVGVFCGIRWFWITVLGA